MSAKKGQCNSISLTHLNHPQYYSTTAALPNLSPFSAAVPYPVFFSNFALKGAVPHYFKCAALCQLVHLLWIQQCPQYWNKFAAVLKVSLQQKQFPIIFNNWSSALLFTTTEAVPHYFLQLKQCPFLFFNCGSTLILSKTEAVPYSFI